MIAVRKVWLLIAGVLLPLAAQQSFAQEQAGQPTPEDDLDCALFLSAVLGAQGSNLSETEKTGITSGMTYFVGRYEAVRGDNADTAMVNRYAAFRQGDFETYQRVCSARMAAFGDRLVVAGDAISRIEAESAADAAEAPEAAREETEAQAEG